MHVSKTEIIVRYNETDKMGIVHHSQYVNYFEIARTDFVRQAGISYRRIEAEGLMMPVLGINVQYHTPALYDDTLLVETSIKSYDSVKMMFDYKIYRQTDRKLLAEGSSSHCWTDLSLHPVSIKKKNKELHALITSVMNRV